MTDLAAEGDRLHAESAAEPDVFGVEFAQWAEDNWPAIAAALRERDEAVVEWEQAESSLAAVDRAARSLATAIGWDTAGNDWIEKAAGYVDERDALRVRAETAEADADRLAEALDEMLPENDTGQPDSMDLGGHLIYVDPVPDARSALAAHAAAVEARHAD